METEEIERKRGQVNRGRLKGGHPGGDPSTSPRCGARAKSTGRPCRAPGMRKADGTFGRCRMHGGASTGPRTPEGRERCRQARLTHGRYSRAAVESRRADRVALRELLQGLGELMEAAQAHLTMEGIVEGPKKRATVEAIISE